MAKKILIAEDDKALRAALISKLKTTDFEVITASSGTEALEQFVAHAPDLLLLDIIMPGKSGFEVLEEIRIKHSSRVPVVILSNLDQPADRDMAKNLKVSDYFVKADISLSKILARVHEILSS